MKHSLFWLLDQYSETGESVASVHKTALEHAIKADRLGYHSLWLAEHHFLTLGTAPNPAVLLAAIAQRTKKLRLGPATVVLPLRDPINVAEDYALVDTLSDGRLNMGVGSGSRPDEFAPFGIEFDTRRRFFTENLTTIRKRWEAAGRGETGIGALNVAPVQLPTPPIYVATMNEHRAHEIGLAGDSMLTFVPPSAAGLTDIANQVRAHAQGLSESGQSNTGAECVVMMLAHMAETETKVKEVVVPALARLMRAMGGDELPDPEAFYRQMRVNGVGLFGTRKEVTAHLQHLSKIGVTHVAFISRFGGMQKAMAARSLQMLAPNALAQV